MRPADGDRNLRRDAFDAFGHGFADMEERARCGESDHIRLQRHGTLDHGVQSNLLGLPVHDRHIVTVLFGNRGQ